MERKIFFSYSWLDKKVADRLYSDLVRSGLNVWRDQIDGDPNADFYAEFIQRIDECDEFLILDSNNYRNRSNWCLTEIERYFDKFENPEDCNIIVCLLEPDGDWRRKFLSKKHKELFTRVNRRKYHELFYDGTYDNEDVYQKSLTKICKLFSKRFVPWNVMPHTRDLTEELSASKAKFENEDRILVLRGYKYISRLVELQRVCRNHFQLWISDCKAIAPDLFFPRWTYCVWLGHDVHQGRFLEDCYCEFKRLAEECKDDPRSFRGLGCVAARLGRFEESQTALKEALRLMGQPSKKWHNEHSRLEVLYNLGQVLINMGKRHEASVYLGEAVSIMESQEGFMVQLVKNYIESLFLTYKIEKCKQTLMALLAKYPGECELYTELGKFYALEGQGEKALSLFESARQLSSSIENEYHILSAKHHLGRLKYEDLIDVINRQTVQDEDNYWKGAICYHFLNSEGQARDYYNQLKSKDGFPWYDII